MKPNTKRFNIVTLPMSRTSLVTGDLCSNNMHKAFIWTQEHFNQHVSGMIGVEYRDTKPMYMYAVSEEPINFGDKDFYFIELDLKGTRGNYANKVHHCDVGVTENYILTSSTNFPFPENCRKIVASNNLKITPYNLIPYSFIEHYAERAIDSGVPEDYIYLETADYYDFEVGDKLEVNKDLSGAKKGDFITVKDFKHKGDSMLLSFEEDTNDMGIHVSHLEHKTINRLVVDDGGYVSVDYGEGNDKTYSKNELAQFMFLAAHKYYEMAIIDKHLRELKATSDLKKDFYNWFNKI